MGKALLLVVLALSTLFGTTILNLNRHSLESVASYSDYYANTVARDAATSGAYMALSKLYQNATWRSGFPSQLLDSTSLNVNLYDMNNDPNLSAMELKIVSTSTFENVTKTTEVLMGIPPNLADLAVFATDTIDNVTVCDSLGNPDPSLAVQNAPDMLPFDKDGLVSLAIAQGHVQPGNFTAPDGYPNNSFYYDIANNIPNVTHINGDFIALGGTICYGIYVVEGNADLNGNSRLEGVVYLPNPGSIIINGGGDPKESSITGGIFVNGSVGGQGNHIKIKYNKKYMEIFGAFQIPKTMYIVSWKESPNL